MDEISRMEKILRGDPLEPVTRLEKFCAKAAGTYTGDPLTPVTRLEWFLDQISGGGGGGETKSTFIAPIPDSNYTGNYNYSTPAVQQYNAPEGIVYDKVWNCDGYISENLYNGNVKKLVLSGANGGVSYRFVEMSHVTSICLTTSTNFTIWTYCFSKATNLEKLAIYYPDGVIKLNNINAFANTPFASGGSGGILYVPSSLITSYQNASNWSTILGYTNNSIQAIEGSEFQA